MKKITLLCVTLMCSAMGFAQFTENFDSGAELPAGWTVINGGDDNTWAVFDVVTEFDIPAHSGSNSIAIEYDSEMSHDDYLITPAITVAAGVNDYFTFWGRSLDPEYPEQIDLKISTTGTDASDFTVTLQANVAPPSGESFAKYSYDLSAYAGQTIYIAFYSSTLNQFIFEVDDVVSAALPTCLEPTSVEVVEITPETATLNWMSDGTSFNIEVGLEGFTQGEGTMYTSTSPTYDLEALSPNTAYTVYIQRNCGSGDLSETVTVNFQTPAIPASNDTCATAAPLTVTNAPEGAVFTSVGASTGELEPTCASFYGNDVWFTVTVPADGNLTLETLPVEGSANDDTIMEVFSGSCDALVPVDCNDDNEDEDAEGYFSKLALTGLTPGATLYVAVWQFSLEDLGLELTPGEFAISAYNTNLSVKGNGMSELNYFPNPVENVLNLTYKSDLNEVAVYNLLGQKVHSAILNSTDAKVDLSSLAAGTYTMKVTSGSDVKTVKILKK